MMFVLRVIAMAQMETVQSPQAARRWGIASCVCSFLQFALSIAVVIGFVLLMLGIFKWGWFEVSISMYSFTSRIAYSEILASIYGWSQPWARREHLVTPKANIGK